MKIDIDAKLVERLATKLTPNFLKGDTRVIASCFERATEMAQEWEFIKQERDARDHTEVAGYLPIQLRAFLEKMTPARRRERELAILKNCNWEGVEAIDLDADELAQRAKKIAALYAAAHPANDDDFKEPEHKRGRCEKEQVRRLRKAQRKALAYVSAALGAVGGPMRDGRPLYISDYALRCYRQQERRTAKILEGLRLIKKLDPKCQISMTEVNLKAQIADVTKRRLLVDMMLTRWKELGWHVCWITVSLPGEYVPHSTNEQRRASKWEVNKGPEEAFSALQSDHHRVLARLRERGVRPSGWWNAQPQQSGTPHRHYILACDDIEDARAVCDGFRETFSTRKGEGEDRGCAAYVIGDEDENYRPRKGKDGKDETAESIAKYAARYSTRLETVVDGEAVDLEDIDRPSTEYERVRAWKSLHGCRTHAWLGLDSARAPGELWNTLWANAQRSDYDPADARMAIAMREMRDVQKYATLAVEFRKAAENLGEGEDKSSFNETVRIANEDAAYSAWHAAVALGMWPDADLDRDELDWLRDAVSEWNSEKGEADIDPLPPMPLRETKTSVFDEEYKKTIGTVGAVRRFDLEASAAISAWLEVAEMQGVEVEEPKVGKVKIRHVAIAMRDAGIGFSKRPDGRISGFDLSGEILMRVVDEWEIVDEETASARLEEQAIISGWIEKFRNVKVDEDLESAAKKAARAEAQGKIWDSIPLSEKLHLLQYFETTGVSLSFSPTDPRIDPCGPISGENTHVNDPPD
ncbi:replication endonuclease [Endobacterium cereale]|uniref:replication endonuclease n=1 Tax=Endobacterium cereale TaxID=2663029 RepID=UPI002B468D21|nr:replication endonuclease [Endobacterium cereale]MEB2846816.1 replication endonuclease [Endobacterium cereale]